MTLLAPDLVTLDDVLAVGAGSGLVGSVVGIDVGGTFTDCVVVDDAGRVWMDKAFTTPSNLAEGIVAALANVCDRLGADVDAVLSEASVFALGTTSLINRVVSRRAGPGWASSPRRVTRMLSG